MPITLNQYVILIFFEIQILFNSAITCVFVFIATENKRHFLFCILLV